MTIVVCDECRSQDIEKIKEKVHKKDYTTVIDGGSLRKYIQPKVVETEITYRCKKCGHEFTEKETSYTKLLAGEVWDD